MSVSTIVDRIRALLDQTPPFDRLPDDLREDILSDVSIRYYEPGEVILAQGAMQHPGLFIVESGLVRLLDVTQGRLIDKVGEGETFGSFGLLRGGASIYEAKAVEPTVCALLKGERFQKLYDAYDDFAGHFEHDLKLYVRRMGAEMDVTGAHLLFSRNLSQFIHRELVTCEPDTTARQAAQIMRREGVDSLVVVQGDRIVGIVTDIDFRNRLVARGGTPDTPVRKLMSSPVLTMPADASIYEAMMLMLKQKVHRLVLTQRRSDGEVVVGVLTDRDISHFRGQDPLATVSRIDNAPSVSELVRIRERSHEQLLNLWRQGALPEMLNSIMMEFYDSLAVRVLTLVEKELRQRKPDLRIDLPWVWIRVGSGGRREMALNSEQHNALIYANPTSEEEAARAEHWFDLIAERANVALEECGFRPSEFVARDPRWRQPLRNWKQTYREWILQADEATLSPVPLFFDLRPVYGEASLVDELKEDLIDALNVQAMDEHRTFLRLMASNVLEKSRPMSFLRKVLGRVNEPKAFDVRESGIVPVVNAARVLALETRYLDSTNTFDRLRHAASAMPELSKTIEDALEAYQYLVDFRLESQLRAVEAGDPPVNQIDAAALNRMQQRLMRNAFSKASRLLDALAKHYDLSRGWLS